MVKKNTIIHAKDGCTPAKQHILPFSNRPTLRKIRTTIPSECFESSMFLGLYQFFRDFAMIISLASLGPFLDSVDNTGLRWFGWFVQSWMVGNYFFALWCLGHDCGHGSLTPNEWVTDLIGLISHTFVLTPYFSFKYSHRQHHAGCNCMERDTGFIPQKKSTQHQDWPPIWFKKHPLTRVISLSGFLTLGWPSYLFFNLMGNRDGQSFYHFNPFLSWWKRKTMQQKFGCIVTDVALVAWIWALAKMGSMFSFEMLLKYFVLPYLQCNVWVSMSLFLQHTDVTLPRYEGDEWDWLRGALGTVDRDFGVLNSVHHNLPQCHLVHHLFANIPCYHLDKATKALAASGVLDGFRQTDDTPWYTAMWQTYRECWCVDDASSGILWFDSNDALKFD